MIYILYKYIKVFIHLIFRIREPENPPIAVNKISIHPGWDK